MIALDICFSKAKALNIDKSYNCMKKRYFNVPLVEKALQFFLQHPSQEVYLREYGRILKISPNSAQRFLNQFVAQNYLIERKIGHLRYFKANLESIIFRQLKVTASLKELELRGVLYLLRDSGTSHAVLFGSAAHGTNDEESDMDIVVITSSKEDVRKALSVIQKSFSQELSVQIFSWSEWKEQAKANKAFYLDVITKGIALIGEKPIVL